MKTVIFDLDGTLADTSQDLIASANSCFVSMGYGEVLDPVADASTAFRGARAMLKLGYGRVKPEYTENDVDLQYPQLLLAYGAAIDVHTRLYDGAESAVRVLLERGYAVGICTNKPEALADDLMRRLGVRRLFASLVGADTLPVRKPDPAPYFAAVRRAGGVPERSLLVGDTATDRETARAAGVASVLVTFGPDGQAVAALEPEALLDHFDQLPDLVAGLIG